MRELKINNNIKFKLWKNKGIKGVIKANKRDQVVYSLLLPFNFIKFKIYNLRKRKRLISL
jgi:hypothetical protein